MDDLIKISYLNDFIFCPISIYFHNLYGEQSSVLYQSTYQTKGKNAHVNIDCGKYSFRKDVFTGINVYSSKYGLYGKIDILDRRKLIERKKQITKIYDGYVFQLYAQFYSLVEMGYTVDSLELRSLDDNRCYSIPLPKDDIAMSKRFEDTVNQLTSFSIESYIQTNSEKCKKCIYESACDRSLL